MPDDALRRYQRLLSTIHSDSEIGATVGALIEYLLLKAVEVCATDILICGKRSESGDRFCFAKLRADGMLTQVSGLDGKPLVIPQNVGYAVKDRVAQVAGFDIDKKASYPLVGRFQVEMPNGQRSDLRGEIIAVRDAGWYTVIRLLESPSAQQHHVSAA